MNNRTPSGPAETQQISDVWLAAYLLTRGHRIIRTDDAAVVDRQVFLFTLSPQIVQDIKAYYDRTALVDPQDFGHKVFVARRIAQQGVFRAS